ncbi:hypothetical protein MPER_09609 [Moniliophthora perniciosa FA553]|nr:hypothetical protein MPER_09609 [Moniliophthora perniciosa FA553]
MAPSSPQASSILDNEILDGDSTDSDLPPSSPPADYYETYDAQIFEMTGAQIKEYVGFQIERATMDLSKQFDQSRRLVVKQKERARTLTLELSEARRIIRKLQDYILELKREIETTQDDWRTIRKLRKQVQTLKRDIAALRSHNAQLSERVTNAPHQGYAYSGARRCNHVHDEASHDSTQWGRPSDLSSSSPSSHQFVGLPVHCAQILTLCRKHRRKANEAAARYRESRRELLAQKEKDRRARKRK